MWHTCSVDTASTLDPKGEEKRGLGQSFECDSGIELLGLWNGIQVCFADSREQADGIYIIAKGWVEISLPVKHGGNALRVLKRG